MYVYATSKAERYKDLVQTKALPIDDLIERARAVGDVAFVKSVEIETAATIQVGDAIEMVMLFFETTHADFVKRRSKLFKNLKTCRRAAWQETQICFYDNHTQIASAKGSPGNLGLYRAVHTAHFPENYEIDDAIPGLTTNNQLIQHFETTRSKAHFLETGVGLKDALLAILKWNPV